MDIIWNALIEGFMSSVQWCLERFVDAFNASLQVMATELAKTPVQFSAELVNTLKTISDSVVVPVAGIILTYILCKDLIDMVQNHNSMVDTNGFDIFKVVLKTTLAILLISNVFDITLAFFDVGQSLVNGVNASGATVPLDVGTIMESLNPGGNTLTGPSGMGISLIYLLFSFIVMIIGFVGVGLIYLIAWSRMVMILIYISVAPIPFATFLNQDWVGGIGQNYVKNLCALAIQGFLMMICLVVYSALVDVYSTQVGGETGIMALVMVLVMMFICVMSLMKCLNLAKSIMQAQ